MDRSIVSLKWTEAGDLVASLPEPERSGARVAVMTALLVANQPAQPVAGAAAAPALPSSAGKITSIRRLSHFTKKPGVSGPDVAVQYAAMLKDTLSRRMTTKECRDNWAILAEGKFNTVFLHRAEQRGLIVPVTGEDGNESWDLTQEGYDLAMKLQQEVIEPAKD